ncbi:MAG: hypothetical protein KDJ33_18905, partial [Gammaproteobacteria bacterium]|nr:hypothetical protein [Gammaproteobacteria bacterium]
PVIYQPDDHEFINDGDARHAPGGSMASTLANSYSGDQTGGSYSAGTTLSDLWTAGLTAHADVFTDHWISPAASGKLYQVKTFGRVHIVQIDTRTQRNPSTPTYIDEDGAQKAWLKARLDDFANDANANTCFIIGQSGFGQFTTKSSEGWERIAATEFAEIIDYIYSSAGGSGIPSSKRVLFISGDDHLGHCQHSEIETASNPAMADPIKGELRAAGCAASFFDASTDYAAQPSKVLWSMPKGSLSSGDAIRTAGLMMQLSDDAKTALSTAWYG